MKNKLREMRNNKKGFTLIEMIVVIVIIAILVALAVPAVMGYVNDAREAKIRAAASAGTTTMQAALAQAESKDKLTTEAYNVIAEKGVNAAGAKSVVACKKEASVAGVCDDGDKFVPGTDSLDNIKTFIFTMKDDKIVVQPATGGAEAKIINK